MAFKARAVSALTLVLVVLALFLWAPAAHAQDLLLNFTDNKYDAYVNQDGTVDISQDLTFKVEPSSVLLDYVDVGLPNDTYDLSQLKASLDGAPLTDISRSQNIPHGLKVVLQPYLQPGQTGILHVEATVRDVLYQDSKDKAYASLELSPTWFDSQYIRGTTRLQVRIHFPPGVTQDEPRYHGTAFTSAGFVNDRAVYTWLDESAGSKQYKFGVSFPAKYVPAEVVQKPPAFNLNLRKLFSSPGCCVGAFVLVWAALAIVGSRTQKRRKMDYLPPSLAVEGTGVKRGLTAVEAAVLLEAPLNKVMTMILFGLVKKGYLIVESEKPLQVKAVDPLPKDTQLWEYEQRFVKAVKPAGALDEKQLHEMILGLISSVNKKLSGFSRKETQTYYKDIAARAWKEVEAANTPEVLGQKFSDGLEWTMLDDDWDHHTRRVFEDRPVILPNWWWGYRPWVGPAGLPAQPAGHVPTPTGAGTPITLPTLPGADFANTVVRGVENTANTVVSSIERFTGQVTQKTNPPPVASSSSSSRSSGGGHSCACACACAGCACACAGGGR